MTQVESKNMNKLGENPAKMSENSAENSEKEGKKPFLEGIFGDKKGKEKGELDLEKKVKELTDSLQRLQAEFENYQKRSLKQNNEFKIFANAKLIEELLPVIDSLEQGMNHNKDLVMIHEQLISILKKNGLEKIIVKKKDKFNHDEMECLMCENEEGFLDDEIVNVLMNGYKLNGKILRATKVSVGESNKKNKEEISLSKTENVEQKNNDANKEELKKDELKENELREEKECGEKKEKNEFEGMTKSDFKIDIIESD
ncbi:MAG: nucleotide exchange factor GrpE [archaeon]